MAYRYQQFVVAAAFSVIPGAAYGSDFSFLMYLFIAGKLAVPFARPQFRALEAKGLSGFLEEVGVLNLNSTCSYTTR